MEGRLRQYGLPAGATRLMDRDLRVMLHLAVPFRPSEALQADAREPGLASRPEARPGTDGPDRSGSRAVAGQVLELCLYGAGQEGWTLVTEAGRRVG